MVGNRPSGVGPDGMIRKNETIKLKIPAGVEAGNYMTVSGRYFVGLFRKYKKKINSYFFNYTNRFIIHE